MTTGIMILFGVMALCFIIRMPVSFSMLVAGLSYFLYKGSNIGNIASTITSNMFANYIMLAAPLFLFTANVMNSGKVTEKVFDFANCLFGRLRGGTGHVNVFASLIFSGMTGSAIADAAGLGVMEIAQMKKEGYDDGFSCAITAASATIGPIFPPSIPMVVYAMLSGASIGKLFMGGMVPGILLALVLMIYTAVIAKKRNYPQGQRVGAAELVRRTISALPALFTPVLLLGGIYGGVVTPTEAGALAALYSLLISFFIYRSLGLKDLITIFKNTATTTSALALIVGVAMLFSYIIALEKVPNVLAEHVMGLTDNKYVFLFIINILFLLLGAAMDTSAIQLVFIPMIVPMLNAFQIDLVHFGVLISLNMMIGLSTPPFGMLLFIVSGLGKTPLKAVIKELMSMVILMIFLLFLVTFVPDIVMFLPNRYG
jgi:tripartite ATP-independent transporter DctM subunit